MDKESYNFREFFTLVNSLKKTANKQAVCNFCIIEYILFVALVKAECFISNKAKLCSRYFAKCVNFRHQVLEKKRKEILV